MAAKPWVGLQFLRLPENAYDMYDSSTPARRWDCCTARVQAAEQLSSSIWRMRQKYACIYVCQHFIVEQPCRCPFLALSTAFSCLSDRVNRSSYCMGKKEIAAFLQRPTSS